MSILFSNPPRLSSMFYYINECVICLDLNCVITEFNHAAEIYYGWVAKDVLGKNYLDMCTQSRFVSLLPTKLESLLKGEVIQDHEDVVIHSDLSQHNGLWTISCFSNHRNQATGFIMIGKDIRKYNLSVEIFAQIPGVIYWKDKEGKYLGCNEPLLREKKLKSMTDVVGKTDVEMCGRAAAKISRKHDKEVLNTGKTIMVEEEVISPSNEKQTYMSIKAPLRNNKGEIIGVIGNSLNITELKRIEEKLVAAQKKAEYEKKTITSFLENVVACTPGNLYWKDKEGRYLGANDFLIQSCGLSSKQDVIGKTDYDIFEHQQAQIIRAHDKEVMVSNKTIMEEETATLGKGGSQRVYMAVKMPMKDLEGNIMGVIGTSLDITKLKETEKALKKAKAKAEAASKAKTEFIANMSHDLRTPVSGILGVAKLLRGRIKGKCNYELLDDLTLSGNRLLRLLNEIIDVAKFESRKRKIDIVPLNMREIIKDVIALMQSEAKRKNLQFIVRYSGKLPSNFIGDHTRVHRILLNLVGNALKFTEKGHVAIGFDLLKRDGNIVIAQMYVKDTGIGIPKDKFKTIFEKFGRLESAYKGNYQGSGLGLNIVQNMIRELKGTIKVESEVGKGTKFICTFPLELALEKTKKAKKVSSKALLIYKRKGITHTKIKNILLVEDDPICQKVEQMSLENLGYQVDTAMSGKEVKKKIKKAYDLILMDVGLGDADGLTLTKEIREGKTKNKDTLVIALTAHITDDYRDKCLKSGMDEVMHKPLDEKELQNYLKKL